MNYGSNSVLPAVQNVRTGLSFAITVLEALPTVFKMADDAGKFINDQAAALKAMQTEDRDPTPAEWDALNRAVEAAVNQLEPKPEFPQFKANEGA